LPPKPTTIISNFNSEKKRDSTISPQKQLNYNSPNVKGVISERPTMSGRGTNNKAVHGMIDESMNVSETSDQSEAVVSSDNEAAGPKGKGKSKNRINETSPPNMRSKPRIN
jgi:hypothetical protein